jgi:hypothetical protein
VYLSLRRSFLLLFGAALAASVGSGGQPGSPANEPKAREAASYTAFPDIKPTAGKKDAVPLPPLPAVGADAPPLRRVMAEQLREGLAYLRQSEEIIRLGAGDLALLRDYTYMTADVFRVAADLEENPTKRVPWYEARVRKLKEFEVSVEKGLQRGVLPSQALNVVRFQRLQAEADLLRLKAEVEKPAGK